MNELQSNPESMNRLNFAYQDEQFRNAVIKCLQADPIIANNITVNLINNPDLTKSILLNLGLDTISSAEIAKDAELRADKIQNNPKHIQKIYDDINQK